MSGQAQYLYANGNPVAEGRLRALEAIEDEATFKLLTELGVGAGWHCLEVGAGAGSIARWLASRCERTVATDLDTRLLDPGAYEVWPHDILKDDFPVGAFDLVHIRHVLIHLDRARHRAILRALRSALKPGGVLLAEESDLEAWKVSQNTPEPLRTDFSAGIAATLAIYRSLAMNPALGMELERLMQDMGFASTRSIRRTRRVMGGSAEAHFQKTSARQLADSVRTSNAAEAAVLDRFAECFDQEQLEYESRATVSVSGVKTAGAGDDAGVWSLRDETRRKAL